MKKQLLIRILMVVIIVATAAFVVAATTRPDQTLAEEECMQPEQDECDTNRSPSEFLLESLTRNLLR